MNKQRKSIAAIVVWYHPDESCVANIKSYQDELDHLYVIDNSPVRNDVLLEPLYAAKFSYIANGENLGIGTALNQGMKAAQTDGFKTILLLDQDSSFENAKASIKALSSCLELEMVFMVSSSVNNVGLLKQREEVACKEVPVCITSGTLLKTCYLDSIGFHDESLFIDYVDFDYALKTRQKGYRIVQANGSILTHKIGETKQVHLWWLPIYRTNTSFHSPLRRYYRIRNSFRVWTRYAAFDPHWVQQNRKTLTKEIRKIILFEDNKFAKLKAIYQGYRDYKRGIYGKKEGV